MPGVQDLSPQAMEDQLHRVADRLGHKYGDRAAGSEIQNAVFEEAERYRDAHVKQYIPVLVQHAVQERLRHRPAHPARAGV
jgi:hypothetical protein